MFLAKDFKEFLRLLTEKSVKYLLIGGYAVTFHGYVRPTGDMDIWVDASSENIERLILLIKEFGFGDATLSIEDFSDPTKIFRMGLPPVRIEIMTSIDGVGFQECYSSRIVSIIDGISISIINLEQLKKNKKASGRHKDLSDLDYLP
ncbi:MAG: nucleotidyltransferase [Candidatus Riflebacteria bacterium]|nr:nucleotidyltransferase [Candidatus Riflebacteria bacterium]